MGASPAFLPSSSLTAVDCSVQCSSHAPPSPVCLCLILNLRPLVLFLIHLLRHQTAMSTLTLGGYRAGTLPPNHHRNHYIPLRSLENRKWKPYLHLYSAKMMEKIKVGSKPSPLKLALEGILCSWALCFIIQGLADTNVCIMLPALPAPAQDGFLMCCGCWVYLSYLSRYSSSDLCIQGDRGEDDRVMYGLCSRVAPSQPRW